MGYTPVGGSAAQCDSDSWLGQDITNRPGLPGDPDAGRGRGSPGLDVAHRPCTVVAMVTYARSSVTMATTIC